MPGARFSTGPGPGNGRGAGFAIGAPGGIGRGLPPGTAALAGGRPPGSGAMGAIGGNGLTIPKFGRFPGIPTGTGGSAGLTWIGNGGGAGGGGGAGRAPGGAIPLRCE
jgi:hypothetical protein